MVVKDQQVFPVALVLQVLLILAVAGAEAVQILVLAAQASPVLLFLNIML
jgi:hypothetical protein